MKTHRARPIALVLLGLLALLPLALDTLGASAAPAERGAQRARREVRRVVKEQAQIDRPGEFDSVSNISFWDDPPSPGNCTRQHAGAAANFTGAPTPGTYFICKTNAGNWKVYEGPLYGE